MSSSSPQFKAVIFDFGNVICFPPKDQQFVDAAQRAGIDANDFVRFFWDRRLEYDRGEDATIYWQTLASRANRTFDDSTVADMVQREIELWSNFDQRVLSWIDDLRRAGLRTGILSNLPRTIGESLRRANGFLDHFDHVTFSYELGMVKPEAGIYQYAVQGLGLQPQAALFLDDKIENVKGGFAVGLPSHVFTTWEEFVANDLARYGLPLPRA